MSYSFEYIDIILLAMIAGFIFLRLRGILGKKTGHEENIGTSFHHDFPPKNEITQTLLLNESMLFQSILTCFNGAMQPVNC